MFEGSNPLAEIRAWATCWRAWRGALASCASVRKVLIMLRYICWSLIAGSNMDGDLDEEASSHFGRQWRSVEAFILSSAYLIFVNYLLIYRARLAVLKPFRQSFANFFLKSQNYDQVGQMAATLSPPWPTFSTTEINMFKLIFNTLLLNSLWRLNTVNS